MNVRQLLEQASKEEYIAVELLARALTVSRRQLMRHLRKKAIPFVTVGRAVRVHVEVVKANFLPTTPATRDHSGHSDPSRSV